MTVAPVIALTPGVILHHLLDNRIFTLKAFQNRGDDGEYKEYDIGLVALRVDELGNMSFTCNSKIVRKVTGYPTRYVSLGVYNAFRFGFYDFGSFTQLENAPEWAEYQCPLTLRVTEERR